MYDLHNHYEIEFDVPSRHRETFEEWLSADAVAWLTHDRVDSFDVFLNDTGLSPEIKFAFGFEALEDWAAFVDSDEYAAAMERFETFADDRVGTLWQRASVKLDGTPDRPVADGGPDGGIDRRYDTRPVITR